MSLKSTISLHTLLKTFTNSAHRGAAEARLLTKLQEEEDKALRYNPYALNETQIEWLAQYGINTPTCGAETHRHVIHKVIENFLLFTHVPHHLGKNFTAAFMKYSKFEKLQEFSRGSGRLINALITPKDVARYSEGVKNPQFRGIYTPVLFMHDALHFYTPYSIADLFLANKALRTIVATTVIPVETIYFGESLYPDLYEIQYVGQDKILYVPEGHHANAYEQPRAASWILTTKKINVTGVNGRRFCINIQRLESICAHHLFILTIEDCPVSDTYRTYDSPKLATVPQIFPAFPMSRRIVPYEYLEKMIEYAKAVRSNNDLNLDIKNRFLFAQEKYKSVPQSTRFLVTHFTHAITHARRQITPTTNIMESNPFYRAIENQFGHLIHYKERCFLERFFSVLDIKRFHFTFLLETVEVDQWLIPSKVNWPGFHYRYTENNDDIIFERSDTPEVSMGPLADAFKKLDKGEPNDVSPPVHESEVYHEALENLEEESEVEVDSKVALYTRTAAAPGNNCGVQVFTDLGYKSKDVSDAYFSARKQVKRQLPPNASPTDHPSVTNFLRSGKTSFPWMSGLEVTLVGAALGTQVSIHTPAACHLADTGVHIYHVNNNHWDAKDPHTCKCST